MNAIYRLGADKAVRLPRTEGSAAADVALKHRWLPLLASQLPFAGPPVWCTGTFSRATP